MTDALPPAISGFRCPVCGECDTDVKDSRPRTDGFVYRRRYCNSCTTDTATVELPAELWKAFAVKGDLDRAADAFNTAIRHFNTARRSVRVAQRSVGAEVIRRKA